MSNISPAATTKLHALEPARLPAEGSYLLLSDLHFGDGGPTDQFSGDHQGLFELLEAHTGSVDAVVLDGDVLDATQAGPPERIMAAHGRVVNRIDELARRLPVFYVAGNHDVEAYVTHLLPSVKLCSEVLFGDEGRVVHGHELDIHFHGGPLDGRGQRSLRLHAQVERLTGQLIRLPFAVHDNATNRFAHWVFYRATMAARLAATLSARLGHERPLAAWAAHHDYWARSQWGDPNALLLPALATLARGPHRVLITGHSHQPGLIDRFETRPPERVSGEPAIDWRGSERRAPAPEALQGRTFVNLGAWSLGDSPYGVWRAGRVEVRDWRRGCAVGDRAYRMALSAPEIPGMQEWWQRYYRGFGRYAVEVLRRDMEPIARRQPTT